MQLKYGRKIIDFNIPSQIRAEILHAGSIEPLLNPGEALVQALRNPISSKPLSDMAVTGDKVAILVNDSTRLANSDFFLPYLLDELASAGVVESDISITFALGSHRSLDEAEMVTLVGEEVASRVKMYNHDSLDDNNLTYFGDTSFGTPVYINKRVAQADIRILTGSVVHHFFAGFGGGRKALVPGVAGWETIRQNHSLLLDDKAGTGILDGNPVHEDLLEAAGMVGCDFLLNTVLDENKRFLGFFAGDMVKAHLAACDLADRAYGVEIEQRADAVIASCGGYPKDINMYQAHKTLDNAMMALKEEGILILLAECAEGIGSVAFEEWAEKYKTFDLLEKAIRREFVLGGHKAYKVAKLLKRGQVYLLSGLEPAKASSLGFIPIDSLDEGIEYLLKRGDNQSLYIIPQGSLLVPRLRKPDNGSRASGK